ncbi:MAG TPA: hypothetical protein VHL80_11660 [Polyangia bacterium]|nr:hypothetical protein [Polyangia bacterium]
MKTGRRELARRVRRIARWAVLGGALAAAWACQDNRLVEPISTPSTGDHELYQADVNVDLDILFMIDDSSSMTPLQGKLTANFPEFMRVLESLPRGLPNVHIGVVSSSMGAGRNPSIEHCPLGGDGGVFRSAPVGATCATGRLDPGQHYISNVHGLTNYTGTLEDVFGCVAALGDGGCGFEHQFASVLRALGADGAPPPAENAGFLRPGAYLLVVLITNEDDCSAPPDSALFDSSSALVSDPLGPLQSYRCNEFGHLCGGRPPPRTPSGPTDLTGTCTSAEDGRLLRVADVAAALKRLKSDPDKVMVAAVAGPKDPYVVDTVPPELPDVAPWPVVDHSCTTAEPDGSVTYGDPSVRIAEWVEAFGGNGVFTTICADSFKPALTEIAEEARVHLDPGCMSAPVLDADGDPWTGATPADCSVVDHASSASGAPVDMVLPECAPGQTAGPTPCWFLVASPAGCAPGETLVQFNRPGGSTYEDLVTSVECSVLACPPKGTPDPPPGCSR